MPPSADAAIVLPHRPFRLAAGTVTAAGIALLVATLFVAILNAGTAGQLAAPVDIGHLLRMTSLQAGLTMLASLATGIGLAWSLNRLRFPGRTLLVALFASAIVTPGMVVAFGLIAVWGRSGWLNQAAEAVTGSPLDISIFGLHGILLAHVILDGALATRVLLARLDSVPENRLKTGQSLGLGAWQRFVLIDWPAMRSSLPGLGAIIFLLAFTSFPIVLLLGGGPANQTLEVAIYSAVRLDFDLEAGVLLALIQLAACSLVILLAAALPPARLTASPSTPPAFRWRDGTSARLVQWALLGLATALFALPLLAVLVEGLGTALPPLLMREAFWRSLLTSLVIGTASALLTLCLALLICAARAATAQRFMRIGLGMPAFAYLAVPAVVLSLGFFLAVRNLGLPPASVALPVVILANSLLALPFAVAVLGPPLDTLALSKGRLISALGLGGNRQFIAIEWPLLGRDIGVVLALSFCFSLGDLGVIALFGTEDFSTLPLLMLRALGAYRSSDAAAIAALLLVLAITVFATLPPLFERLSRAAA